MVWPSGGTPKAPLAPPEGAAGHRAGSPKRWPEPQRFPQFLDKMGKMMGGTYDWSAEVKKLPMPVMLVFADNDSVPPKHIAAFFALLGGGVKEPGWQNTQLSKARLAVVPGYSHYNFITSTELAPIIDKYLADPLTNPPAGAAAASRTAKQAARRAVPIEACGHRVTGGCPVS